MISKKMNKKSPKRIDLIKVVSLRKMRCMNPKCLFSIVRSRWKAI